MNYVYIYIYIVYTYTETHKLGNELRLLSSESNDVLLF
jgi:hypothetical protein